MGFRERAGMVAATARHAKETWTADGGGRDMPPHMEVWYADEGIRDDCNLEAAFMEHSIEVYLAVMVAAAVAFDHPMGQFFMENMPDEVKDSVPEHTSSPTSLFVAADGYWWTGNEPAPADLDARTDFENNLETQVSESIQVVYGERNAVNLWRFGLLAMPYRFSDGAQIVWDEPVFTTDWSDISTYPVVVSLAAIIGPANIDKEASDDLA